MKRLVTGILALAILNPWSATARASSAGIQGLLQVRATIQPCIKFSATQRFSNFRVTSVDIRRGFIDLPKALTLKVQANIRGAIRFDLSSSGPERILALEGGINPTEAVLIEGQHPALPVVRVLDMRVILPVGIQEGTYPLQVLVAPVLN